jgi:replicative DNA helicase
VIDTSKITCLDGLSVPPNSVEAERQVLGAMLVDELALLEGLETVQVSDFYYECNQFIFQALWDLNRQGVRPDVVTVPERLRSQGQAIGYSDGMTYLDAAGGLSYINDLVIASVLPETISHYAAILRDKATRRTAIVAGYSAIQMAYDEADDGYLDRSAKLFEQVVDARGQEGLPELVEFLDQAMGRIDQRLNRPDEAFGVLTGFDEMDRLLCGFQAGHLVVVAARPSMGKTAFAINVIVNAALYQDKKILFFSLEMPGREIAERILYTAADTTTNLRLLDTYRGYMAKSGLKVVETPGLTVGQVKNIARKHKRERGLDLVVVDYLGLLLPERNGAMGKADTRNHEIEQTTRALKHMAKEFGVPIILVCQLNRENQKFNDKTPHLAHLRDSGAIEQDADEVLMLHRDDYYDPQCDRPGITDVFIRKNRNGPQGKCELRFNGPTGKFWE